ncbi:MAG: 4-(cytidine 5'-diphospho)-2-C-methyl-D-erythritol kinase [Frankiaceae bacterium]
MPTILPQEPPLPSRHPAGSGRGLAQVHDPVTVRAPAKINLFLGVGGLRPDGYHAVTNVAQAVSLYDEVTARAARGVSASVRGEGAGAVPSGLGNLAVRAAEALRAYAGVQSGVHLEIRKTIPVAAGLAGGSADAAAALVACDRLWRTGLDRDALTSLAADCGSDVPFALSGGVGLGTGRGEQVSPVLVAGEYHWVLAFASGGLSTPAVYSEFDRLQGIGAFSPGAQPEVASRDGIAQVVADPPPADRVLSALRHADAGLLADVLRNDLAAAAVRLRPDLSRTLDAGREMGALAAIVSGSGPTCAFLTSTRDERIRLAAGIAGAGVCRAVQQVSGPVHGARVVSDPQRSPTALDSS